MLRSPAYASGSLVTLSEDDTIDVQLHANRSYECAVLTNALLPASDDYFAFTSTAVDPDGASVTLAQTGTNYPGALPRANGVQTVERARVRVNLIAQKTGRYRFSVEEVSETSPSGSASVTVQCRETTLLGGYNRFFAGVVIVEIQSLADVDQSVFVTIVDSNGNTQVDNQEFTAQSNTRTDLIFSDLPAQNFGQIRITHNAPFGSLRGIVAEYDFGSDGSITLKRERPLENAGIVP